LHLTLLGLCLNSGGREDTDSSSSTPAAKRSEWSEHTAPDGRVYYYNSVTKHSLWEKPDELKTPSEVSILIMRNLVVVCSNILSVFFCLQLLLSKCPWKEYQSENGKTYYHNVETKQSVWTIPEELKELKARLAAEEVQG